MVTVRITSGFANQLYYYACGYAVSQALGQPLSLDISVFFNGNEDAFQLEYLNIPTHSKFVYRQFNLGAPVVQDPPAFLSANYDRIIRRTGEINTREDILTRAEGADNIYLYGPWFNHYYAGYEAELRELFRPKRESPFLSAFKEQLQKTTSVALHIRGTSLALTQKIHKTYYQAALAHLLGLFPDALVYVFSDNIDYAKAMLGRANYLVYIKSIGGCPADIDEFSAMSHCTHHIGTTLSSFSAMAAILYLQPDSLNILYRGAQTPEKTIYNLETSLLQFDEDANYKKSLFYIDDEQIPALVKQYEQRPISVYMPSDGTPSEKKAAVLEAVDRGEYPLAENLMADISLDYYEYSPADYLELADASAAIHLKSGRLSEALDAYSKRNKHHFSDADWNMTYAEMLLEAGRPHDAALHFAVAKRLGEGGDDDAVPEAFAGQEGLRRIYRAAYSARPKHFIFCPSANERSILREFATLCVYMMKMGHKVSYILNPLYETPVAAFDSVGDALRGLPVQPDAYGLIKRYGGALYSSVYADIGGEKRECMDLYMEVLRQRNSAMQNIVVFRNPAAVRRRVKGLPYLFVDTGKWERDSERIKTPHEGHVGRMLEKADCGIILNGDTYAALSPENKQKSVYFQPTETQLRGGYAVIEQRMDYFSEGFMDIQELAEQAALLSELSDETWARQSFPYSELIPGRPK